MEANIEAIVNDLKSVSLEQVIYEAIMNSIQANASNIRISIHQNSLIENDTTPYINKIEIADDGDGFTEENTQSFKQYRTTHKRAIGGKGVGRFLFLKLFEYVSIDSFHKHIDFTIENDVQVKPNLDKQRVAGAHITLSKPKGQVYLNTNELEQNIKEHFLPHFSMFKDNEHVKITVLENGNKLYDINSEDIPLLKIKLFKIKSHEFSLRYIIDSDKITKNDGFYCANNRVVVKNSDLDSRTKLKAFKNVPILYLLSSEYLDRNVNDERDNFRINPQRINQDDLFGNLSWTDIQDALAERLREILLENNIDINEDAKKHLVESIEKAPYLAYYLQNNEFVYTSDVLITNAKKQLEEDKKFLRNSKNEANEEYQQKLSIVTQAELAEYIFDRQRIIEKLKQLTDDKVLEKEIHNLFMKQKSKDDKQNYKSNNLWLFDDRFMTYDKVFSDKQIKEIFPDLNDKLERPDLLSIVSNTYEKDDITDIVIIELKKPDDKITPARAEEQLIDYASYVNSSRTNNKIRVWTYAFLKFNEEIEKKLKLKTYNEIPTHNEYPIYYKYWEGPNTIINFLDYGSIAHDANMRNKTFMKILKGDTIK